MSAPHSPPSMTLSARAGGLAMALLSGLLLAIFAAGPASARMGTRATRAGTRPRHHVVARSPSHHSDRRLRHRSHLTATAHTSVINGLEATPGSFPYMAAVEFWNGSEGDLCSGTVVSNNVVLTAAHCVLNETFTVLHNPSNFTVITGNVDWASSERTVSSVTRVAVDPNFAYLTPSYTPARADVAVLGLSTPISAPAVRLATSQVWSAGTGAVMAGWGRTVANGTAVETLHVGEAAVQSAGYCASEFSHFDSSSMLCVLDYPKYRYAICHGDSGGPLLMIAPGTTNEPLEIGIASFGGAECPTDSPQYYTRADSVAAWVNKKISEWAPPPPPPPPPPAPTPPAETKLPTMTSTEAKALVRQELTEDLGARFRRRRGYQVSCKRIAAAKQECEVSWSHGPNDYYGWITVYYLLEHGEVLWNDRYAIHWVNDHCYFYSHHRSHCRVHTRRR